MTLRRIKSGYSSKYVLLVVFSLFMVRHMPGLFRYIQRDTLFHHSPEKVSLIGASKEHPPSSLGDGTYSLWHNEYNVVHVVHTRFMQHQGASGLGNLAEARLELFKTFCVPAMRQQTTKQFLWIVWTDPNSDKGILRKLKHMLARVPNALILAAHQSKKADFRSLNGIPNSPGAVEAALAAGSKQMLMDYNIASRSRLLLETRVDADDALRRNFVESVQAHASRTIGQALKNEQLLEVFCPGHHVEWRYYKPDEEDHPSGHLVHHQNRNYCLNSGLTVAYHLGATNRQIFDTDKINVPERLPTCVDEDEEGNTDGSIRRLRGGMDLDHKDILEQHAQLVESLVRRHHVEAAQELVGEDVSNESVVQLAMRQRKEAMKLAMQFESETLDLGIRRKMQAIESEERQETVSNYGASPNECWRPLYIRGSEDDRFISTGAAFRSALLMSRTPTSAGMNNVIPNSFVSRHSIAKATYELDQHAAWDSMARHFAVSKSQAERLREHFEHNIENILTEAMAGQCSEGHSCKKSARKALSQLIDRVRWQKQNHLTDAKDPQLDGIVSELTDFLASAQKAFGAVMDMVGVTDSHSNDATEQNSVSNKDDDETEGIAEASDPFAPSSTSQTVSNDIEQAQAMVQETGKVLKVEYDDNWEPKRTTDASNLASSFVETVTINHEQASTYLVGGSGGSDSLGPAAVDGHKINREQDAFGPESSSGFGGALLNSREEDRQNQDSGIEGIRGDALNEGTKQGWNMVVKDVTRVNPGGDTVESAKVPDLVSPSGSIKSLIEPLGRTGDLGGAGELSPSTFGTKKLHDEVMDKIASPLNALIEQTDPPGEQTSSYILDSSSRPADEVVVDNIQIGESGAGEGDAGNDNLSTNDTMPDQLRNGDVEKPSKSSSLMDMIWGMLGGAHRESLAEEQARVPETPESHVATTDKDAQQSAPTIAGKRPTSSRREAVAEFFHTARMMPGIPGLNKRPVRKASRKAVAGRITSTVHGSSSPRSPASTSATRDAARTASARVSINSAKAQEMSTSTKAIPRKVPVVKQGISKNVLASKTVNASKSVDAEKLVGTDVAGTPVPNRSRDITDSDPEIAAKALGSSAASVTSRKAAESSITTFPKSTTSTAESSEERYAAKNYVPSTAKKASPLKLTKPVPSNALDAIQQEQPESTVANSTHAIPKIPVKTASKPIPGRTATALARRVSRSDKNNSEEEESLLSKASKPVLRKIVRPAPRKVATTASRENSQGNDLEGPASSINAIQKTPISKKPTTTPVARKAETEVLDLPGSPQSTDTNILDSTTTTAKTATRPATRKASGATTASKMGTKDSAESPQVTTPKIPASTSTAKKTATTRPLARRVPTVSATSSQENVDPSKSPDASGAKHTTSTTINNTVTKPVVRKASTVVEKTPEEVVTANA